MANYCNFEIKIKGRKGNALLLAYSIPVTMGVNILSQRGNDEEYEVVVSGECKWSVNYAVSDEWFDDVIDADLNLFDEDELRKMAKSFWKYSLRAKSGTLDCEVLAHYWSVESDYDTFVHYVNGYKVKKRRIVFDSDVRFDWDTLEFEGREGEFDEDATGEERSLLYIARFDGMSDPAGLVEILRVLEDQPGDETMYDDDSDDDDSSEDEDDEEEEEDEEELLPGPCVAFDEHLELTVSERIKVYRSVDEDGDSSYSIKWIGDDDSCLDFIVRTWELEPGNEDCTAEEWIEMSVSDDNETGKPQILRINDSLPAVMHTKKLEVIPLFGMEMKPVIIELVFRCGKRKGFRMIETTMMNQLEENEDVFKALAQIADGFRVDGKPINAKKVTQEQVRAALYPVYEEDRSVLKWGDEKIQADGYSIALPKGFCKWECNGGGDLLYYVTPEYAREEDINAIPMVISMDKDTSVFECDGGLDFFEHNMKMAQVRYIGTQYAEDVNNPPLVYALHTIYHETAGIVMLSFCTKDICVIKAFPFNETKKCCINCLARIPAEKHNAFKESVGMWLGSTLEFDGPAWEPSPILLENKKVLKDLLSGKTDSFDAAVDQLVDGYRQTSLNNIAFLDYCGKIGVDVETLTVLAERMLNSAFENKAFSMEKTEEFLDKLRKENVPARIWKHIFEKLEDFDVAAEVYRLPVKPAFKEIGGFKVQFVSTNRNNHIVTVSEPVSLKAMLAGWRRERKEKGVAGSGAAAPAKNRTAVIESEETEVFAAAPAKNRTAVIESEESESFATAPAKNRTSVIESEESESFATAPAKNRTAVIESEESESFATAPAKNRGGCD